MESLKYQTLEQRSRASGGKALADGSTPAIIDWGNGGKPAELMLSDGRTTTPSCVRCSEPPCLLYGDAELSVAAFPDFPLDRDPGVCPTGALSWPIEASSPRVQTDLCISCGICVSRCPIGAIYLGDSGAQVNDEPNECFRMATSAHQGNGAIAAIRAFASVKQTGKYRQESRGTLEELFKLVSQAVALQGAQFPNHLTRNLFLGLSVGAGMRRRGDTNVRMDMVLGPPGMTIGIASVEVGSDLLEAPRRILDGVAVLGGRYRVDLNGLVPVVVTLSLPNLRSEYWQLVSDVRSELGLTIGSLTLGAMVLLTWNRVRLTVPDASLLFVDGKGDSLEKKVEGLIGRRLEGVGSGYPGLLESAK